MNASLLVGNVQNRRIELFSLNNLFAHYPERNARKGEVLTRRSNGFGYVYYLVQGMVKTMSFHADKKKEIVNGYFASDELMNLECWNKKATQQPILKVTSAKAIYKVIPIGDFRNLVRENPHLNQLVMQNLMDQLAKNNDRLHRILLYKSRQRVIRFLQDYVREVGQRVGYEHVIKKPFTHEEMGNLSDTSRQTVTTVLNELKAKNIIHFTRRYILVRDLEGLAVEAKREER